MGDDTFDVSAVNEIIQPWLIIAEIIGIRVEAFY